MHAPMLVLAMLFAEDGVAQLTDASPLHRKAEFFQEDLVAQHLLEGLYVSIVPVVPKGVKLRHDVHEPGHVIHAGVWTGRYLAGVGYQYAVTKDPKIRALGGEILQGLRKLQEVTGKPGLLARGFVRGHGPVETYERDGNNSAEWHQGQGKYADYRFYGDVSVDNFNAVLYGYAIYFDLAADAAQQRIIAQDTDRLMTHLLDHHCRIVDLDGEVTQWGHVGFDPDPARDEYYLKRHPLLSRYRIEKIDRLPLRASLMLLPDLLIAHHLTGNPRYRDYYRRVVERYQKNPEFPRRELTPQLLARMDHSPEGQQYEALYNLIRYESDPALLAKYRGWVAELWRLNWMEGNALFAFMTVALLPEKRYGGWGSPPPDPTPIPQGAEGLRLAKETLRRFPLDRVFRPVMNSLRADIAQNPFAKDRPLSAAPLPINERPHDNEYEWKGNPYQLDGWLKTPVVRLQFACDDPQVAWFCDAAGRGYLTLDWPRNWRPINTGLMGAAIRDLVASPTRTFVIHAQTDRGVFLSRDGGLSWRPVNPAEAPPFPKSPDFKQWLRITPTMALRINEKGELVRTADAGKTVIPAMNGWRVPRANTVFATPKGVIASGPGGCYLSSDGVQWAELPLWRDEAVGAADFLHAYWMGRYYGLLGARE